MDVMDSSVFDFLMGIFLIKKVNLLCAYLTVLAILVPTGNADRHHYETYTSHGNNGRLLHIDNGKRCFAVTKHVQCHA